MTSKQAASEEIDLEKLVMNEISDLITTLFSEGKLVDVALRAQEHATNLNSQGLDAGIDILAAPGPWVIPRSPSHQVPSTFTARRPASGPRAGE